MLCDLSVFDRFAIAGVLQFVDWFGCLLHAVLRLILVLVICSMLCLLVYFVGVFVDWTFWTLVCCFGYLVCLWTCFV